MELIDLIGNFKTREMERKTREEMAPQKKRTIAFKFTPTIFDEDDEEEDDEDLSLLVKNVRRIYNKAKFKEDDGKVRRTRRLFASIAGNPDISLPSARGTKASLQPPRSLIKRRP